MSPEALPARPDAIKDAESTGMLADPVVHIIDDDEAVRRSLALLLKSHGHTSEVYDSAESFLNRVGTVARGCVIVDIRMPGMNGLMLQQELKLRGWALPVIIVTAHGEIGLAVQAMKAGAVDFIEKPYSEADMTRAVDAALVKLVGLRQHEAAAQAAAGRLALLTPRERDVLRLLVDGRPNKVIAHELGISPRTAEIHRANVMDKLGVRSLAAAVRIALNHGPLPK
jgi:two-component system response regulator FixJ